MDNGKNRLELAAFVGVKIGPLSRDAIQAAWVALAGKGKQKGRDLQVISRIREVILADLVVSEKGCEKCGAGAGTVAWDEVELEFRTDDDFLFFAKTVAKLVDEDGVEPALSTGALQLHAACETKADDLKAAKKTAEAAKT